MLEVKFSWLVIPFLNLQKLIGAEVDKSEKGLELDLIATLCWWRMVK